LQVICLAAGKKQTMRCILDGIVMDEFTGKANKMVEWATGQSCTGQVSCSFIPDLQAVNPDATFTCIASAGKQQTVQCDLGDKQSTQSGKKKVLLQWAASASCLDIVEPEPECSSIPSLQSLNPNATFECLASAKKSQTIKCSFDGGEDTLTGKAKVFSSWAVSSACGFSDDNGGGGGGSDPSCICETEVANFSNIQCIAENQYSCTDTSGNTINFKVKKCKKLTGKKAPACASINSDPKKKKSKNKNARSKRNSEF